MDVLPCKLIDCVDVDGWWLLYSSAVCCCITTVLYAHTTLYLLYSTTIFRMAIAGWVANEAIPGALPVWHP